MTSIRTLGATNETLRRKRLGKLMMPRILYWRRNKIFHIQNLKTSSNLWIIACCYSGLVQEVLHSSLSDKEPPGVACWMWLYVWNGLSPAVRYHWGDGPARVVTETVRNRVCKRHWPHGCTLTQTRESWSMRSDPRPPRAFISKQRQLCRRIRSVHLR